MTHKKVLKGLLESGIAERVAGGVDGAVDVTQPVTYGPYGGRDAGCAEAVDEHHHIVWGPGDDEGQEDGQNRPCHFFLSRRGWFLFGWLLCHLDYFLGYAVLLLLSVRAHNLHSSVGRGTAVPLLGLGDYPDACQLGVLCFDIVLGGGSLSGIFGSFILFQVGSNHTDGGGVIGALLFPLNTVIGHSLFTGFSILNFAVLQPISTGRDIVIVWFHYFTLDKAGGNCFLVLGGFLFSLLYPTLTGSRDLPVKDSHDDNRQIEGCNGSAKSDSRVGKKLDVAIPIWDSPSSHNELPKENCRGPEDEGQHPGGCDHHAGHLRGPLHGVRQRLGDTKVPVKADDEQVHYRGVADHVVKSQPEVTHHRPQGPVAYHSVEGVQVHGKDTDDQVSAGQAEEEIIVDSLEVPVDFD